MSDPMNDNDSVTMTETTSWFSRIKSALAGILIGIILVIASIILLIWNEKNSVLTYQSLIEGQKLVRTVPSTVIDPNNNGKLVHVTGLTTTQDTLTDPNFNISQNAIQLKRQVQMYQWQEEENSEKKHNTGGSTTTEHTYTYKKVWASTLINSSGFKNPKGHQNPTEWPYQSNTWQAKTVNLDAFHLSPNQISRINNFQSLPVTLNTLPEELKNKVKSHENGYYLGENSDFPEVGDLKIKFSVVTPNDITIIASQIDNTFEPFQAHAGKPIDMLTVGKYSSEYMFAQAFEKNELMTWGLRLAGLITMWIGFYSLSKPIVVFADFLPFFGLIADTGMGLLTFLIAFVLSLIIISFAWITYHPLVGSLLLALALVIGIAVFIIRKRKLQNAQQADPDVRSVR